MKNLVRAVTVPQLVVEAVGIDAPLRLAHHNVPSPAVPRFPELSCGRQLIKENGMRFESHEGQE